MNEAVGLILGLIILLAALGLYMLPTAIARDRKHKNYGPIAVINLFFGWTFLGWIGCLAWALSSNRETVSEPRAS